MGKLACLLFALVLAAGAARGAIKTPEGAPVEITSTGETRYENGLATARENVAIHVGDTDIYADFAQYDSRTHEILVEGHVRIYRDIHLYIADRATYNTLTKSIRATNMRTSADPYFVSGEAVTETSDNSYRIQSGTFTTHDTPVPDFHLRAHTIRVYENDRVIFQNVTFYVGKVPVLWWPYMYQSLNDAFTFTISPAYLSSWGPSVLSQVVFPIRENISGKIHLDYRGRRGFAVGFDADIDYGKDESSSAKLKTYYIQDQNPLINRTTLPRGELSAGRYRISLENTTNFASDVYGIIDITKLSDKFVMQDFYQTEFRYNPMPDDMAALTKSGSFYTLTAITRFQANEFFEQTERLPEIVLDVKRHALFGSPVYYESETGFADLHRSFANDAVPPSTPGTSPSPSPNPASTPTVRFEDYGTIRLDTFHQLVYPRTYFGWLSIVPRVGFRATYYDKTRDLGNVVFVPDPNPLVPVFILPEPTTATPLIDAGSAVRTIFNTGAEGSFKISREWDNVENRELGLDGLLHVIQPFANFSYAVHNGVNPASVLMFDRFEPTTQLRPIDFPQFTTIDSIDDWTILRVGVRNRLETRRDDQTITWFELESFFDVNFENPYNRSSYSNFFNNLRFTPLPWVNLRINSQVPAFARGFTEVNTTLSVQPVANLQVSVGHRYLNENPFFPNSSLIVVGGFCRLNDNWSVGVQEQYEENTGVLEQQRYAIYRDLSNWVASIGAVIRDNAGVKEYGFLFTFTLKAFPKLGLDLNFDPGAIGGENQ